MEILIVIVRWLLFLAVISGLLYQTRNKLKVEFAFVPLFVFACVALVVYFGGLIGLLLPAVYLIVALGLLCFCFMIKARGNWRNWLKEISLVRCAILLVCLCFLAQLLQTDLSHYDNYSHWAVVVKEMLITKAFPTADSVLIDFKNYPLGMSSFLYFICEMLGHSQSNMVFGQGLIICSCFGAIFGIVAEKKRFLLFAVLATGCSLLSLFSLPMRINNLLVDFVLPLLALAAIAAIYRHRGALGRALIVICPVLGLLGIVKSTGIIYIAFAVGYLVYTAIAFRRENALHGLQPKRSTPTWTQGGTLHLYIQTISAICITLVPTLVWNLHVKYAFADESHKFTMDSAALQTEIASKSQEEIATIVNLFLRAVCDITTTPVMGIVLFEALGLALCIGGAYFTRKKWALPKAMLALNLVLVLYFAGILAMYLFSMPLEEALYLAGFERYASSIVIFFGGALSICATTDIERSFHYRIGEVPDYQSFQSLRTKGIYNNMVVVCLAVITLILSSEYNGLRYLILTHADTLPAKVVATVGDEWQTEVDTTTRYLVYASDTDAQVSNNMLQYVSRYYLRASDVDCICYFYEDNLLNLLSEYDTLIIIESDADQQALLQTYFGVDGAAGIYDVATLLAAADGA